MGLKSSATLFPSQISNVVKFKDWLFKNFYENLGVRNGVPDLKKTLPWNKLKRISNTAIKKYAFLKSAAFLYY